MSVSSPILLANILRSTCSPSKQPHLLQPPFVPTTAATSSSIHAPRSNMIASSALFHSNNSKRGRRRPRDSDSNHLMSMLDSDSNCNEIDVLLEAEEAEANEADDTQQIHKRARMVETHSTSMTSLELSSSEISPSSSPFDLPSNLQPSTAASLPLSFAAFSWNEAETDRQWSCSPSTSPENTLSQSHTHSLTSTTRATSLDLLLANRGFPPSSLRWIEDTDRDVDPDEAQRLLKRRRMLLLQPPLHPHAHAAIPATVLDETVPAGGKPSTYHASIPEVNSVNRNLNFSLVHSTTLSFPIASTDSSLSILSSTTDSSQVIAASPFPHNYLRGVSDTMSTAAVTRILKYVYVFGEEYGHRTTGHSCVSREEIALAAAENHDLLYGECLPIGVTKLLDEAHLDARNAHSLVDLGSGIGKLALQAFMQYPNLITVSGCELASSRFQKSVEAIVKMHEARESYRLHCANRPVRRASIPHSDDEGSQYDHEDEEVEAEEEEEEEQKASCPDERFNKRKSKHHLPQLLLSSSFHHNDEQLTSIRYSESARACPTSKKKAISKRNLHPHWHDLYAFEAFVEDHEKASISLEQEKQLELMRMLVGTGGASSSDSEDPPAINCLPPSVTSRPPSTSNVTGEGDDNPLDPRRHLASQERVAKLLSVGYDRAYQASRDRLIHAATSPAASAHLSMIPPTRTLELRCLNLFEMSAALTADIVICETKFTSDNYPALCNFLLQFKRGCRLLTYENLDAVFQHVYGNSTDKPINQQLQPYTAVTATATEAPDPSSKKKEIPSAEIEAAETLTATPKRVSKKKSKKSTPTVSSISNVASVSTASSSSAPTSAPSSRSSSFSSTDSSSPANSVARRTRHSVAAAPIPDSASSVSTVAVAAVPAAHPNRESKRKREASQIQSESSIPQPTLPTAALPSARSNSHSSSNSPACGSSPSNPTSASSTTYSCSTSSSSSSVSNSNSCVVPPHPKNPFRQLPINVSKSDRFFTSWASNVGHHFFLWKKVE